jgi:hypothetical protein
MRQRRKHKGYEQPGSYCLIQHQMFLVQAGSFSGLLENEGSA